MTFVQSWLSENFVGRERRSVAGLLRHCESTDLQVSRLGDAEQCHPWEQLLKKGTVRNPNSERMLSGEVPRASAISEDSYCSSVCAKLESLERTMMTPRVPSMRATKV